MKKQTKYREGVIILSIVMLAAIFGFKLLLAKCCIKTNSPFLILIDMSTNGFFFGIIFLIMIAVLCIPDSRRTMRSDLLEAIKSPLCKKILTIILIFLVVIQALPYTERFDKLRLNGKKPLRLQYNYALIRDALDRETETVKINGKNFRIGDDDLFSITFRQHGPSRRLKADFAYYSKNSVYLYADAAADYIDACQKSNKLIEVTYYKHSGIIQTIDDIYIYDREQFDQAADELNSIEAAKRAEKEEAEKREKEAKEAAEAAAKEAEEKNSLALFDAFFGSAGENYAEIAADLERRGIENTYDIIYISTDYFASGEVAFFDNLNKAVYVARDNDKEEMVQIPPLPYAGTLTEIGKILDDAGIKWRYDCFGCKGNKDEADHSKDVLHTYHCSPGTPIPKDYEYWFSVYHVG
ncbi:MAG: hypothetical protein IK134_13930 [Oscillospiraceae bacterium]|nr:hypothetical protein [Oscillospiraceae bacterium]